MEEEPNRRSDKERGPERAGGSTTESEYRLSASSRTAEAESFRASTSGEGGETSLPGEGGSPSTELTA